MDSLITSTSIALGEAYMDGAILGVIIFINVLLFDVEEYAVQRIFCRWHRKREYRKSGNAKEYEPYLKAIGAAEEKDDIGHSEIVNHFNPQWIKFHTFP